MPSYSPVEYDLQQPARWQVVVFIGRHGSPRIPAIWPIRKPAKWRWWRRISWN